MNQITQNAIKDSISMRKDYLKEVEQHIARLEERLKGEKVNQKELIKEIEALEQDLKSV